MASMAFFVRVALTPETEERGNIPKASMCVCDVGMAGRRETSQAKPVREFQPSSDSEVGGLPLPW